MDDFSVLEFSRDLAVVLLVLEVSVFILAIGAALYFAARGVRAVKRWIRLPLLNAQVWAMRIQDATVKSSNVIIELPIAAESAGTRLRATLRAVGDFFLGV